MSSRDMYLPSAQEAIQRHRAQQHQPPVVTNIVENAQGPVTIVNNIGYSAPTWVPPRPAPFGPLSRVFLIGLATLIGVAMIIATHGWLLVPAAIAGGAWLGYSRIEGRKARVGELAKRADEEHRQYMAGDPAGLYGRFEPEV